MGTVYRRQESFGLSLMEVTFSLFLLGLVTVFVMNLFPSSMITVKQAEYKFQANLLCETLLAEELARPYESLEVASVTPGARTVERVDYVTNVEVLEITGRDPDHIKNIRATVSWTISDVQREVVREQWFANLKR